MPIYTCELCKKEFPQKGDLTKHKRKRTPCIPMDEIQRIVQAKEVKTDIKSELKKLFKQLLDILRDNETLMGEKALRNMAYLLTLKFKFLLKSNLFILPIDLSYIKIVFIFNVISPIKLSYDLS